MILKFQFSYSQPGYKIKYYYNPTQFSVATGYGDSGQLDSWWHCCENKIAMKTVYPIVAFQLRKIQTQQPDLINTITVATAP